MAVNSRRDLLRSIAAAATVLPAAAQHEHPETAPSAKYTVKVFSPEELKAVAKMVDLIIPRTDTPGASDVYVPEFIDRKLSLDPSLKARFMEGFRTYLGFDEKSADDPFFKLVKDMTIDGYYTSKEGLTQELGWHGNTYLAEFKGCTHPEHQS